MKPEYVLLEEEEPETVRYEASPPVSAVRDLVKDEEVTLASHEWPKARRWPLHIARIVSFGIIAVLMLQYPWPPTLAIVSVIFAVAMIARYQ